MEASLREQASELLVAGYRSKDEFLAMLAHELVIRYHRSPVLEVVKQLACPRQWRSGPAEIMAVRSGTWRGSSTICSTCRE